MWTWILLSCVVHLLGCWLYCVIQLTGFPDHKLGGYIYLESIPKTLLESFFWERYLVIAPWQAGLFLYDWLIIS